MSSIKCIGRDATIYVLIQSYNRLSLLESSISSLLAAIGSDSRFKILIYDAGSSDGSRELLEHLSTSNPSQVQLFGSPPHLSFSAGHNLLLNHIPNEAENDMILFYETDNALTDLSAIDCAALILLQQSDVAAVGFTVKRYNGGDAGFGSAFPTKLSFILGQRLGRIFPQRPYADTENGEVISTEVAYTSPLMARVESIRGVGGFDESRFPFSHSDTDLCWSLSKSGGRILVLKSSSVIHDNLDYPSEWSGRRVFDFHRATFRILEKHRGHFTWLQKSSLLLRHTLEIFIFFVLYPFSRSARRKLSLRTELARKCWYGYEG